MKKQQSCCCLGLVVSSLVVVMLMGFFDLLCGSGPAFGLESLDDSALEQVVAAGGVSVAPVDVALYWSIDRLRYVDTDTGHALQMNQIRLHDGAGGPLRFGNGSQPVNIDMQSLIDPFGSGEERSMLDIEAQDWRQQLYLSVEQLFFCGQELGRLDVDAVQVPQFYSYLAGHGSGVDVEVGAAIQIDSLRYTYNVNGQQLAFNGLTFAAGATGVPEDPTSWAFSGNYQIGDLAAGRPARLDVVSEVQAATGEEWSRLRLQLPSGGSVRLENLHAAGRDFGPLAIDGLRVHRLQLDFVPGG